MAERTIDKLFSLARLMGSPALKAQANLTVGVLLELTGILFGVAGPYLLKCLVDRLSADTAKGVSDGSAMLTVLVVGFIVLLCGGSVISTVRMLFTARVIDTLNVELATRALRSRFPTVLRTRDGDSAHTLGLLERLPFSLNVVCEGLIWRTVPMFIQVFACLAVISGLIPFGYVVIMAAMLIGFVWATWFGAVRQQRFANEMNAATGAVSQILGDVLRNAKRVALNGALEAEIGGVRTRFFEKRAANEGMWWSLVKLASLQYGVVGVGLLLLLLLGAHDVTAGRMTVGDFVLLQAYAIRLTAPLSSFGFTLSQAGVSLANLGEVLNLSHIDEVPSELEAVSKGPARLVLEHIDFEYGPGLAGISNVSFDLEPGTFNVIVGANGSGKSTLAQVLAGVLEPSRGKVVINGRDLKEIARSERYRHIMYVPQFIGLFHRSLGANVLYPPTRQTAADIQALLSEWRFYEAGRQIDFGVLVGEQGERLSGGQIQKLELARLAGVKVPAIILDESTSSLDSVSEERVIDSLIHSYGAQTTIVLITHRPRLAEIADQVLFMEDGRLGAAGRHGDLIQSNSRYSAHWSITCLAD